MRNTGDAPMGYGRYGVRDAAEDRLCVRGSGTVVEDWRPGRCRRCVPVLLHVC